MDKDGLCMFNGFLWVQCNVCRRAGSVDFAAQLDEPHFFYSIQFLLETNVIMEGYLKTPL